VSREDGDERVEAPAVDALPPRGGGAPAAAAVASGLLGPSGSGWADGRAAVVGKHDGVWCELLGTSAVPAAGPGAVVPESSAVMHHGGAGSQPGSGGPDPTFRSPMVVWWAVVGAFLCPGDVCDKPLGGGVHLVASVCAVWGFGVGVGPGEIPAFAGDGNTRGCRLPPWGRRQGSDCSSPHRASGETLDPGRIGRRRHHDVAPFLKASPWLLM
jgi:hypothetical protein